MMEIKSVSGAVLYRGDSAESLREAVIVATRVGANLSAANLSGAFLADANLSGANLRGAYLRGANMSGANLSGANLSGAYLSGADLSGAYLRGANLRGANLSGANLSDAYLRGANLSDAYLSDAYLGGTCVDLLLKDDGRGYQVVAHRGLTSDGEALYLAGCRQLTLAGARKHWGNPNHPNPEAAARILAAIEAHQNTL